MKKNKDKKIHQIFLLQIENTTMDSI